MTAPFTKKRLCDITIFEDTIDKEYRHRVERLKKRKDLVSLLEDFEEFLPSGIQKFRDCDDNEFRELLFQIKRIYEMFRVDKKMPAEATEAVVFVSPPLISRIRVWAMVMGQKFGKYKTWGQAFRDLQNNGDLKKLIDSQEGMYRHVIAIKEKMKSIQ